jgi:RHS repeat-associated protein
VSVILTEAGAQVERIKYSAYGRHFAMPAGDNDSDGDCNGPDAARFPTSTYDVRCDLDLDGDNDNDDYLATLALSGTTLGYGKLSRTDTANRKGYAGYENDGNLLRFYHVRHRVLDTLLGRWTRRDLLGFVDGANLYQYARSAGHLLDPLGLSCDRYDGFTYAQCTEVGHIDARGCAHEASTKRECLQCCAADRAARNECCGCVGQRGGDGTDWTEDECRRIGGGQSDACVWQCNHAPLPPEEEKPSPVPEWIPKPLRPFLEPIWAFLPFVPHPVPGIPDCTWRWTFNPLTGEWTFGCVFEF